MILYHVSTDLKHTGEFTPRIPQNRHQDAEDITTPRVSAAPTIEDCLTAIPDGGSGLEDLHFKQRGYFKVFKIDTEKLGITKDDIVKPETLYENDRVRDADFTNEHWIKKKFSVPIEDQFLIRLVVWEETCEDVLPHSIFKIADEKYEGNYLVAYEEEHDEHVPCSIRIYELDYIHEDVSAGEEITLYYDTSEEKEVILKSLEDYAISQPSVSIDEITFIINESCNLRELFLHHSSCKA